MPEGWKGSGPPGAECGCLAEERFLDNETTLLGAHSEKHAPPTPHGRLFSAALPPRRDGRAAGRHRRATHAFTADCRDAKCALGLLMSSTPGSARRSRPSVSPLGSWRSKPTDRTRGAWVTELSHHLDLPARRKARLTIRCERPHPGARSRSLTPMAIATPFITDGRRRHRHPGVAPPPRFAAFQYNQAWLELWLRTGELASRARSSLLEEARARPARQASLRAPPVRSRTGGAVAPTCPHLAWSKPRRPSQGLDGAGDVKPMARLTP